MLFFLFLSVPISLLHVLLSVYIPPFAFHPHRTRVGWVRRISFCPIQHLLELPMGSCKAASLLFRYHLHINTARELVEKSLMRRQLWLQIFCLSFPFYPWSVILSVLVTWFWGPVATRPRPVRPRTHSAEDYGVLGLIQHLTFVTLNTTPFSNYLMTGLGLLGWICILGWATGPTILTLMGLLIELPPTFVKAYFCIFKFFFFFCWRCMVTI